MKIETLQTNFTANAIALRKKSNLTQQQLSEKLNIKRSTIGAIEEGRALGVMNLYLYSMFFSVSINDLIMEVI